MTTNSTDQGKGRATAPKGTATAAQTQPYRRLSEDEYHDIESRILYEDNHVLVFNKRAGEIVQGDKTGDEPLSETLKAFIAARNGKPGRVFMGVPHRLDRPVSGAVIMAKTSKSLERLSEAFRNGDAGKIYWALTEKAPDPAEGEIRSWLVRNEKQNKSYSSETPKHGAKEAVLRYRLLRPTKSYFLVEVQLLTGRHHQIRCQLASIGCPIKGDLKYGARRSNPDGSISLHARQITFLHPTRKEQITVTAPTPMEKM